MRQFLHAADALLRSAPPTPPQFAAVATTTARRTTQLFAWRLDAIDWGGPWGWGMASVEELVRTIIPRLQELERCSWTELAGDTREVAVSALRPSARERLAEIGMSDVPALIAVELAGRSRVWGVREGAALKLLWWDPAATI